MTSISRRPPTCSHGLGEASPCANMDIQRLRDEVVAPARAGQAFSYQAYSCREGAYLPPRPLGPAPLVIVEGSYSHHPSLAPSMI